MNKSIIILLMCVLAATVAFSQYTTDKVVGKKNAGEIDSLKTATYPYLLPIWGDKVVKKGFKIPRSAGFSAQYLWQESLIDITNLQVGFNNGPMHSLDEIIRFNSAKATSNGLSVRPDVWILPFLNIYGIFAKSKTSTAIDAGLWIPDSSNAWHNIGNFSTKANFDATTYGFGITPTIGIGGFFMILDMNFSWSDIQELAKPAFLSIFGPRIGKNITWPGHPEKAWTIWAGGFRIHMNSGTTGSISTSSLFPIDEWNTKVNNGIAKVGESQQKVDAWWAGLTPPEQKNPVNIAKHETADAALAKAGEFLDAASHAVNTAGNSTIQYSLEKKQKDMWNFLIGTQFQFSRAWMIRAEYGFLGSRQQLIAGLQYRFNL